MKELRLTTIVIIPVLILLTAWSGCNHTSDDDLYITYEANPKTQKIAFYYRNADRERIGSLGNLQKHLAEQGNTLLFAMNAGMFQEDFSPLGLYIENGKTLQELNTKTAKGNFYLKPNGIFYLTTDRNANVCTTQEFSPLPEINYATQSGPMLVMNGEIHNAFTKGSANKNIRNGVGILPNGHILFSMSREKVNLYDFAKYFLDKGCKNALYLDGFVSRTYAPSENFIQRDGNFGAIIGVTK